MMSDFDEIINGMKRAIVQVRCHNGWTPSVVEKSWTVLNGFKKCAFQSQEVNSCRRLKRIKIYHNRVLGKLVHVHRSLRWGVWPLGAVTLWLGSVTHRTRVRILLGMPKSEGILTLLVISCAGCWSEIASKVQ